MWDFFCTSARPFPAGGFPPKVLQGNAGHLGDCFSAEKYRPHATILLKNALPCNFSAEKFANVHFFLYLCRLFCV